MAAPTTSFVRIASLSLACLAIIAGLAHAQAPAPSPAPDDGLTKAEKREEGRRNQKIERIHVDDGGAKVDELRYGGQTQSITVTPKNERMPQYEVVPNNNNSRTGQQGGGDAGGGTGPTLWNIFKF
ncbi:hypothetical protein [Variovorax sp. OV329]|uniref:hypothetical protein n=1 Tax=Variovorax sp. OV329 TaxID=1882825 RepID=UPI0008EBAD49|nr:hypothetical protein [Variovorax sp. OV329]SFM21515.1 hypothetical protein SAMN05444747_103370 [Variovorax sp. OV329]